jgi:hypothetical protein
MDTNREGEWPQLGHLSCPWLPKTRKGLHGSFPSSYFRKADGTGISPELASPHTVTVVMFVELSRMNHCPEGFLDV